MPKKNLPAKNNDEFEAKKAITADAIKMQLAGDIELRSFRGVANYLELLMNAHRLGVVSKDILTGGVYAGGILLQALKMAKEEQDPSELLPANLKQGRIDISDSREDMVALLTAGSSAIQIRLLKRKQQEGKIITVEATEVGEAQESLQSLNDKGRNLINLGKTMEEELFADEDEE